MATKARATRPLHPPRPRLKAVPKKETLAELFKREMDKEGISQRQLAAMAGSTKSSIFFLLQGQDGLGRAFFGLKKGPNGEDSLAERVAAALGVSHDEFSAAVAYTLIGYFLRKPSEQGKVLLFSPR